MITIIGTGPGDLSQMTPRAEAAVKNSGLIVGYTKYVELIQALITDQQVMSTGMKSEVERCRFAVEEAAKGRNVAVVSSGDAGIYGMAGLVYELAEPYPDIEIEVIPGITAAGSAAAVLGAPLMNDFAVISLSDLLTDWALIEKRLHAAGTGEFVIALYNPSSKKRSDYMEKACRIILQYRDGSTPCGYVQNIGREGECYKICSLEQLMLEKVDMFTTVIIGNSKTKVIHNKLVTVRGYRHGQDA